METTCFRLVQEALTNIVRHSQAGQAWVELRKGEAELHLMVRDDGSGFDVEAAQQRAVQGASLGLLGMQERVLLVGGQFDLTSTPRAGTTLRVRLPLITQK
jgi:signal transduction histidine kinase